MNQKNCDHLFKNGENKLKTSFFSLKFSPDYVGAVDDFTAAGKGYRQLGNSPKAIVSFKKAIECNHKMNDYYSEGNLYVSIAEIYFFDEKNPDLGIDMLNKASYAFQVAGKLSFAVKSFITTAERFMEKKEYDVAEKILKEAFNCCCSNPEEKLVGASFEQIYNKLLDVECGLNKWPDAINLTQQYIDSQLKYPERDGYRLSKTYMKLAILRIINNEDYLCESIYGKMYETKYDDTITDVSDLRKCIEAIKFLDKKKFTYCISSAFTLFENNLLKGLQTHYRKKEEEAEAKTKELTGGEKIVVEGRDNVQNNKIENNVKNEINNNEINTDINNNTNDNNNQSNDNNVINNKHVNDDEDLL